MPLTKPFSLPWSLAVGDSAPQWTLPSSLGRPIDSEEFAGSPLVLCFLPPGELSTIVQTLEGFRNLYAEFCQLGVSVVGVTKVADDSYLSFARRLSLPFPLVVDAAGTVSRAHGAARRTGPQTWALSSKTLVLDAGMRVAEVFDAIDPVSHAGQVLQLVRSMTAEPARVVSAQAPVLIVPNVLSPRLCGELIRVWETEGNIDSGFMRQVGDQTVGMIDYRQKIRRDHFLAPGPLREHLNHVMFHRVKPQIEKAYHFEATRFEDFRIACYDAATGGYFRRHRDNTTTGTAHRASR